MPICFRWKSFVWLAPFFDLSHFVVRSRFFCFLSSLSSDRPDLRSSQSNLPKLTVVSSILPFRLSEVFRRFVRSLSSDLLGVEFVPCSFGFDFEDPGSAETVSSDWLKFTCMLLRASFFPEPGRFLPVHWYHPFWLYSSTGFPILQYGILYKVMKLPLFIMQKLSIIYIYLLTSQEIL